MRKRIAMILKFREAMTEAFRLSKGSIRNEIQVLILLAIRDLENRGIVAITERISEVICRDSTNTYRSMKRLAKHQVVMRDPKTMAWEIRPEAALILVRLDRRLKAVG